VLVVWLPVASIYGGYPATVRSAIDVTRMDGAAQDLAADGCALARSAGLDARPLVAEALWGVAPTIDHVAEKHDVDPIVMGTRSRESARSPVLGSVSHTVAQHARRALLVVPLPAPSRRAAAAARPPDRAALSQQADAGIG
jgi:nucleotide-binding universal stress UspA family protein